MGLNGLWDDFSDDEASLPLCSRRRRTHTSDRKGIISLLTLEGAEPDV